jgi:N-acetylglucosaminylphosphatidylinositol deacetylase
MASAAHLAMRTLPVAVLVGICATVVGTYSYATNSLLPAKAPALRNKRICLLIAHPDDEAMFFAPTLLALTHPDAGNHVKILCLSTGGWRA